MSVVTNRKSMTRRRFAATVLRGSIGLAAAVSGCGGGGSSPGKASPTQTTRAKVLGLHDVAVRGVIQSAYQSDSFAHARNGYYAGAASDAGTGSNTSEDAATPGSAPPIPLLGAFLRNVASASPASRRVSRVGRGHEGGNGSTGTDPAPDGTLPPPDMPTEPPPTFYFDDYLGLWVQMEETGSASTYLLYEDQGKERAAGSISTIYPVDWETFPQKYTSRYEFTRGYLAGSNGFSENVTNADYSGSSRYENVYADGAKDKGESNWSAEGDFSWSSRTDAVNQDWSEGSGVFRADGSGGARFSSSDGYKSDYRYSSDGSGQGQITGPDPGLPASISWDTIGNTVIIYADGSTERISGWGSISGGGAEPLPVDSQAPVTSS